MRVLLAIAAVALVVAFWRLLARLRRLERTVTELRFLGREIEDAKEDLTRDLAVTRMHVAAVAAGEPPASEAIVRGVPYRDVSAAEAFGLWEQTPGLVVLDVRTPGEFASGHIPGARLVPVDELEGRVRELPPPETTMLVTCAAGGRSAAACDLLGRRGYTRLLNLVGGMGAWSGPRESGAGPVPTAEPLPSDGPSVAITYRGGTLSEAAVTAAIRECYDPEIPLNVYDLGLVYGIDIDPDAISVRMTLTSQECPSARTIPEDVKRRIVALGQPNVSVDIVWDPPWHPSRISAEGKQKLGLG